MGEQCREHMREPFPIQAHRQLTGHQTTMHNFNILGREGQDLTRLIKEAIFIRVNNPTLKRDRSSNLVIFGIGSCLAPLILKQPFHKGMCSIALSNYINHSTLGCSQTWWSQLMLTKACRCSIKCSVTREIILYKGPILMLMCPTLANCCLVPKRKNSWCRFLILLYYIKFTIFFFFKEHTSYFKTSFHALLSTSSGLRTT